VPDPSPDAALAAGAPAEPVVPPPPPPRHKYDRSIVEGDLKAAIWKLAWPTMLTNILGGLQGMVDHVMVGHYVGYAGNAAIGVATQLLIMVVAFIMSVFTGMSVLVSRFVGADDPLMADRAVYQAFLTALAISLGVMAPVGYFAAPAMLEFVNASDAVQAQALPYLRISFMFSTGMLLFYLLGGALRSAGDARTPMVLGIVMTVSNVILNIILIPGLGPIPALGTAGAAIGTVTASTIIGAYGLWRLWHGGWVVSFPKGMGYRPDWPLIRTLFRFGLPAGFQGIAMNIGGVLLLAFIGSLAASGPAQAAYAVSYTQLFAFITWTSVGLMGAAAVVAGQNLGAKRPDRTRDGVREASRLAFTGAACLGLAFLLLPRQLLGLFGMDEPAAVELGVQLLRVLSVSGLFIAMALAYTGGLQGTGDTRSPLFISIASQIVMPLGICFTIQQLGTLQPLHVWLAILVGHFTRFALSRWRFEQGKWKDIAVN
jgi:putative MATE family efflux protein